MSKLLLLLVLNGLLAGGAPALDTAVRVKLEGVNNSAQYGLATLQPEGNRTRVVIALSGGPAGVSQPAHIHLGRCGKLDKAPKWMLKPIRNGRSVTMIPASIETILGQEAAINVHRSSTEPQLYVACGNLAAWK